MADKGNARRPAGQDLGASSPDRIRNVVLVGPGGSGKTTLVETLLASAGAIPRAGTVKDGTTVCDFDEAEEKHGRSISLAIAPVVHRQTKINLVDTPGYADFVGDVRAGLRAADCALFVIAANDGVDDGTKALWRECADVGMPRAVVITKLDQARADYDGVLAQAQAAFGDKVMPLYVPRTVTSGRPRRGHLADRPARARRRQLRGPARLPDRGRHRGVRGRDPDGPLPRRRGDLARGAHRRPRDGRRPRDVLPRRPGLLPDRRGLRRAARPRGRPAFPSPQEHPSPEVFTPAGAASDPIECDPKGSARGRDREDDQRPVRRPAEHRPRLLRHSHRRAGRARLRPLHVVLRSRAGPRGPRRGREDRRALLPLRPHAGAGRGRRRR